MGVNSRFARARFLIRMLFFSLWWSGTRTLAIFIAIMLGACVSGAFINVYLDIDSKMRKELKAYGANLIIAPQESQSSIIAIAQDRYEAMIHKIDSSKLLGHAPYLFGLARLSLGEAVVVGVDFAGMKISKPFLEVLDGSYINVDFDERNALVGVDLAKKMELHVGSLVDLTHEGRATKIRIKGIVSSGDKEDNMLFVALPLAQRILGKEGTIHFAEAVVLGDFDELSSLGVRLSDEMMNIKPLARISLSEGIVIDKIRLLMALVAFIVLLITSMCIHTTLGSIIFARSSEIALLRSLGASKGDIVWLFIGEMLLLTLSASLFGAFLALLLSQWIGIAVFGSGIDVRALSIPLAMGLSLIFAMGAAYYPIKRTLTLRISNILRGE